MLDKFTAKGAIVGKLVVKEEELYVDVPGKGVYPARLSRDFSQYADKDISQATRFTTDILGSIVKMSPYIAVSAITGGVGGATLGAISGSGTMYVQVYTDSMAKAISEGATREQATEYAHISAMIEAGTEMLSGGIPGAPKGLLSSGIQGKIDDVVKVMVKDGTFRKFISTGVDVFGEGAEEALAEYLGSMALSIYTEDERSDEELTNRIEHGITILTCIRHMPHRTTHKRCLAR